MAFIYPLLDIIRDRYKSKSYKFKLPSNSEFSSDSSILGFSISFEFIKDKSNKLIDEKQSLNIPFLDFTGRKVKFS